MSKKDKSKTFEEFKKLEQLNAQIDVWIDEENYKSVFSSLELEDKTFIDQLFDDPICSVPNHVDDPEVLTSLENRWLSFPSSNNNNLP